MIPVTEATWVLRTPSPTAHERRPEASPVSISEHDAHYGTLPHPPPPRPPPRPPHGLSLPSASQTKVRDNVFPNVKIIQYGRKSLYIYAWFPPSGPTQLFYKNRQAISFRPCRVPPPWVVVLGVISSLVVSGSCFTLLHILLQCITFHSMNSFSGTLCQVALPDSFSSPSDTDI